MGGATHLAGSQLPSVCMSWVLAGADGRLAYHYVLIDIAAVPEDPQQEPQPADDADAAKWFPVTQLRGMKGEWGARDRDG